MVGNIICDDFFFFNIHGQIEIVHVWNRGTCFRHFMKFAAILVQVPPPISHTMQQKKLMDLSIS